MRCTLAAAPHRAAAGDCRYSRGITPVRAELAAEEREAEQQQAEAEADAPLQQEQHRARLEEHLEADLERERSGRRGRLPAR